MSIKEKKLLIIIIILLSVLVNLFLIINIGNYSAISLFFESNDFMKSYIKSDFEKIGMTLSNSIMLQDFVEA